MDKTITHGTITHALETAERFFEGFVDDDLQEGIDESLALIRKAKATLNVLVGVSIDDLKTRIAVDMALLRLLAEEPVTVDYSCNVSLEIRPVADGDRLNVCHRTLGWTGVRYSEEGLSVAVFDQGCDPTPLSELAFDFADLAQPD